MNIVIRACDDWVAVYKDGYLVEANHSVSLVQGLEALGIEFERHYYEEDEFDVDTITLPDGSYLFPERLP